MKNVCKNVLRDRVVCFIDSVGLTPLACFMPEPALSFRHPQLNRFPRVCLPTLFAAVLKLFLPKTTSAISGAANSDKSAPTYFAAGTQCLQQYTQMMPEPLQYHSSVSGVYIIYAAFHIFMFRQEEFIGVHDVNILSILSIYM